MNAFFQIFSRVTIENDFGLTILISLISALCFCVAVYVFWYLHLWFKARNWTRIDGRIIVFEEGVDRHGSEAPKLNILYEYSIDEQTFFSKKFHLGWHRDRPGIASIGVYRDAFSQSGVVQVFVDSKNYERSTLDITFDVGGIGFLLTIFLAGSLSILLFLNLP